MEGERVLHQVNRPTHENMKNASPLSTCSGFVLLLVVLALCGRLGSSFARGAGLGEVEVPGSIFARKTGSTGLRGRSKTIQAVSGCRGTKQSVRIIVDEREPVHHRSPPEAESRFCGRLYRLQPIGQTQAGNILKIGHVVRLSVSRRKFMRPQGRPVGGDVPTSGPGGFRP